MLMTLGSSTVLLLTLIKDYSIWDIVVASMFSVWFMVRPQGLLQWHLYIDRPNSCTVCDSQLRSGGHKIDQRSIESRKGEGSVGGKGQ